MHHHHHHHITSSSSIVKAQLRLHQVLKLLARLPWLFLSLFRATRRFHTHRFLLHPSLFHCTPRPIARLL